MLFMEDTDRMESNLNPLSIVQLVLEGGARWRYD